MHFTDSTYLESVVSSNKSASRVSQPTGVRVRLPGIFVLDGEHRLVDDRPDDPEAAVSETLDAISGSKLLLAQLK